MKSITARYDGGPPSTSGSPDADYFCSDGGMIVRGAPPVVGDGGVFGDLAVIEQGADGTGGLVSRRVRSSARADSCRRRGALAQLTTAAAKRGWSEAGGP
jgi:hypothetical protein